MMAEKATEGTEIMNLERNYSRNVCPDALCEIDTDGRKSNTTVWSPSLKISTHPHFFTTSDRCFLALPGLSLHCASILSYLIRNNGSLGLRMALLEEYFRSFNQSIIASSISLYSVRYLTRRPAAFFISIYNRIGKEDTANKSRTQLHPGKVKDCSALSQSLRINKTVGKPSMLMSQTMSRLVCSHICSRTQSFALFLKAVITRFIISISWE